MNASENYFTMDSTENISQVLDQNRNNTNSLRTHPTVEEYYGSEYIKNILKYKENIVIT